MTAKLVSVVVVVGGVVISSHPGFMSSVFFKYCLKCGMSLPISMSSTRCSDTPTAILNFFPSNSRVTLAAGK